MKLDIDLTYRTAIVAGWCAASWHWLSGRHFIPWDSVDAFFPQVAFIVATLRRGEWPTWNPLAFGGLPVLGDPQGMVFTPHVLTGLLSGPAFGLWVFDATTLACMLAGGLCLYSYARGHGGAPPLAALGALVFLLGGYGTSRLQHVPQIISFALLPVLMLTFRNLVHKPSIATIFALGATGALLALNPNHVVFLVPFLLGPLLLLEWLRAEHPSAAVPGLLSAVVLVALIAAPSLSAILETVAHSTRQTLTLQSNTPASLPSFTALSLVVPGIFGARTGSSGHWGPADVTEAYLYIGIIPTFIILLSMARSKAPSSTLSLIWVMGLITFLFAMGTHGPLFPLLYENLPGFSLFRRPSDGAYFLLLYCALAVALADAPGGGRLRGWLERLVIPGAALLLLLVCVDSVVSHAAQVNRTDALVGDAFAFAIRSFIAVVVALFLWMLLPHSKRTPVLYAAALALTTLDLASAGRNNSFTGRYTDYGAAAMYRVLYNWQNNESPEAVSMRQLLAVQTRGWRVEVIGGAAVNAPMVLGLPMSQGYNPLALQRYAEVFGAQHLGVQPKQFSTWAPSLVAEPYRWLSLRFLLLHNHILDNSEEFGEMGQSIAALREAVQSAGGREIATEGAFLLLELPNPYPRAGIIPEGSNISSGPISQCEIISEETTRLEYRCETPSTATLVIGDSFAPGWTSCVNGEEVTIEPFLHALRSIQVPEGISFVELHYQPVPFLRGLAKCTLQR